MKRLLYIPLILTTAAAFGSCSNNVSMGDQESEIKRPPISLPGDVDGDGVLDENDNCPTVANADQADSDGNGMGDICEGLAETCESNFCQDNEHFSGYHCADGVSIRCGVDGEGCMVEAARSACSYGCEDSGVNAGLCEGTPYDPTNPAIDSASGSKSNGGRLTLTGEDFGSHPLRISSGVGPNGWIESNSLDTAVNNLEGAPGWDKAFSSKVPAYIDDRIVRTGNHSINASTDHEADQDWQKSIRYVKGDTFDKIYAAWHVYFEPKRFGRFIQWKHFSVSPINYHSHCAAFTQISSWEKSGGLSNYASNARASYGDNYDLAYRDIIPDPFYSPAYGNPYEYTRHARGGAESYEDNHVKIGKWALLELYLDSSDVSASNGRFEFYVTREGEKRKHVDTWTQLRTRDASCENGTQPPADPWTHFILLGYLDDNGGTGDCVGDHGCTDEKVDLFYDDVYVQTGTKARVMLCDQQALVDCTQIELQTPKAWSDTEIDLELNHGTFQPGDHVFLFIVREDGKVSGGFPITLE